METKVKIFSGFDAKKQEKEINDWYKKEEIAEDQVIFINTNLVGNQLVYIITYVQ